LRKWKKERNKANPFPSRIDFSAGRRPPDLKFAHGNLWISATPIEDETKEKKVRNISKRFIRLTFFVPFFVFRSL